MIALIFILLAACASLANGVSPYLALGLPETANQKEVIAQYKKLTSKLGNAEKNRLKRELYDAAYK